MPNRRVFLLEGEAEKRENRLATEVGSLLRASMRADEQIRAKNTLEAAISNNEEDIDELENHLKVKLNLHKLLNCKIICYTTGSQICPRRIRAKIRGDETRIKGFISPGHDHQSYF